MKTGFQPNVKVQVLDICKEIAEKLKDPYALFHSAQNFSHPKINAYEQWSEIGLGYGIAGIILFFGVYSQLKPDEGWDEIAHNYIKICVEKAEKEEIKGCSLFGGLTGLCYATYICSQNGQRYQNLLNRLDALLIREIDASFQKYADKYFLEEESFIPPNFYNLANGISGILLYLLLRKENPELYRVATDSLYTLVRLLSRKKMINGRAVPAWFVSPEFQFADQESKYPEGSFILSVPHGICGCLAVLSLMLNEGVFVSGQHELVSEIAGWLKDKKIPDSQNFYWPNTLSAKPNEELESSEIMRDVWLCGTPAVCRCLFLAGTATRNHSLKEFAESTFLSVFSKKWQDWNLMGTSFIWGRAGLLALTHQMAQDTANPFLHNQIDTLAEDLLKFYDYKNPFGFQTLRIDSEDLTYHWVNHPGFLDGTIGIILSLVAKYCEKNRGWQLLFL